MDILITSSVLLFNRPRSHDSSLQIDVDRGISYSWSRFPASFLTLISMASLSFLFNQMSSLANTLTLSLLFCDLHGHSVLQHLLVGI